MTNSLKLYLIECPGVPEHAEEIAGTGKIGPTPRPLPRVRSLVVEAAGSLVLVEPGLSTFDWLAPRRRANRWLPWSRSLARDGRDIVRQRLERNDLSPDRVEHIVLTHTHPESMGGVSDFPLARIHALTDPRLAKGRSHSHHLPQLAQGNQYVAPSQELVLWHGFRAHRLAIPSLEVYLLEMPGHTAHHAGVLLSQGAGYVLHLGHAVQSLDDLLNPARHSANPSWLQMFRQERPFSALLTYQSIRALVRHPPGPLTILASSGATARLSLGPGPHPDLVVL